MRGKATVQITKEVLSHLRVSSKYIHEHIFPSPTINLSHSNSNSASVTRKSTADTVPAGCCLERFTHLIGTSVCYLEIDVNLSQIDDLVNFLRLLTCLEGLILDIMESEPESTTEIAPSSVVVPQLRSLFVILQDQRNHPHKTVAQVLRRLFSMLTHLYPDVESLILWANNWPYFASSYMGTLRRLKELIVRPGTLGFLPEYDSGDDTENESITLHSLEHLTVEGHPIPHRLRTPNLLSLGLYEKPSIAGINCLGMLSLRRLTIRPMAGGSYSLNPLDYPVLFELDLGQHGALKQIDILSFSGLSSIRLKTDYLTNFEGNHLCAELLCNLEGCPLLQELHFNECLEWDILILMLERRNFGPTGTKRIHTVTLPFIPYSIHQTLALLLAGETAVRPPLESISLEAARELLFDPDIPGCCRCLKNMVPGCREKVRRHTDDADGLCLWTSEELYPEHVYQLDRGPSEIRDWMDCRRHSVDAWKTSYNEFRQEFTRLNRCNRDAYKG